MKIIIMKHLKHLKNSAKIVTMKKITINNAINTWKKKIKIQGYYFTKHKKEIEKN